MDKLVLNEFLVSLSLQDNLTDKLNHLIDSADSEMSKFASELTKNFALASASVITFTTAAIVGLAKFAQSLEKYDSELEAFANKFAMSKEEAYKTKSALDVMGKSMEEIQLDPNLLTQFKDLKANAESLKVPDMTEGLNTVRAITTSVLALKQTAMNALSWVGHSFLKYVAKPMDDIQKLLKGFNEAVKKNIPEWADKIGKAMSWVVQFAGTIIRAGAQMLSTIKNVFDAIPNGVKISMAAFALLGKFINANPLGRLIMIITAIILLLDDFYTYIDGGDSLLGPVWQTLINIFDSFKKYIPTIKQGFQELLKIAADVWGSIIQWVKSFFTALKDSNAIENFKTAFEKTGIAIGKVFEAIKALLLAVFGVAREAQPFLVWMVTTALPGIIDLISNIISWLADVVSWLEKLGALKSIVIGIGTAFLTFKAVNTATSFVKGLTDNINNAAKGIDALTNCIKTGSSLFGNFGNAVSSLKSSISALNAVTIKAGLAWIKSTASFIAHRAALIATTVAQKAVTAAQWLMNAAMSANPIGIIIVAVIALIAIFIALWKNNESFRNFFIKCWDGIKSAFNAVVDFFNSASKRIVEFFKDIIDWVKDNWKTITLFILNPFAGIFKYLYEHFEGFRNFINGILDWFREAFQSVSDFFKVIWKTASDFFKEVWNGIVESVQSASDWLNAIFSAAAKFFMGLWEGIKAFFQGVWDFLVSIVKIYIAIWQTIFQAVGSFFRGLWLGISNFFSDIWNGITSVIKSFINFFMRVFNGIKSFFTRLWDSLSDTVKGFVDKMLGFFKPVADFFNGIGKKIASIFSGKKTLSVEVDASGGHAEGGVFTKEHYAQFAEGDKPEAVIPLTKPKRAAEVMREAADYMISETPSAPHTKKEPTSTVKSTDTSAINKLIAVAEMLTLAIKSLTQTLNNAMASGNESKDNIINFSSIGNRILAFLDNADRVMSQLGRISQTTMAYNAISNVNTSFSTTNIDNKQNYTINDASGFPRVTADMVSRTQALHNRNLKGVFA